MKRERNAIIMAAGMATRFVPLSLETPKALLNINGEVLIERQIMQLREAGIKEIVIVVGYLKEKFQYLQERYGVQIIENPYYEVRNNHSTLFVARQYLGNTFICSGDNYFQQNVFREVSEVPYYASVYESGETNEWCFQTDASDRIVDVTIGGKDSWIMKGHAFFTYEFSEFLKPYIIKAMEQKEEAGKFWENLYMEHITECDMFVKKYEKNVIEEFDSLEELRGFDERYKTSSGCSIIEKICRELKCSETELSRFQPVKSGEMVTGFTFLLGEREYNYQLCESLKKERLTCQKN